MDGGLSWFCSLARRALTGLAIVSPLLATQVHAEAPAVADPRLAAALAQSLDRRINTERGGIRIVGYGQAKAKNGAIFFIHGDPEWHRIGAFSQTLRDEETRVLANHLDWLRTIAAQGRYATYFVARTGMFGSDGETSEFRREEAYLSIGHAIDTVIEKDGIKSAAIVGHSGGAAVALDHAISRPSAAVPCYALASGVYNIGAMAEFQRYKKQPASDVTKIDKTKLGPVTFTPLPPDMVLKFKYYEPLFHIVAIPQNPARRILAVANRRDQTAPYFASEDLVGRLKALGHNAELIEGAARPPAYHYTYESAIKAAAACLGGTAKR